MASVYNYNMTFYTGNKNQPDTVMTFVKSETENTPLTRIYLPTANWMGIMPVMSTFSGIARIIKATKVIFNHISQINFKKNDPHLHECWNGFKNLFRGLVESVPIIGNISLMFFEGIRAAHYDNKVSQSLKDQSNIAGIAVDGKVIFELKLETIKKIKLQSGQKFESDQQCLDALGAYTKLILDTFQKNAKKNIHKKIDFHTALTKIPEAISHLKFESFK